MKKLLFIFILLGSIQISAAQSPNVLLGNKYEKAASASNISTLYFSQKNSGIHSNTLEFLGKKSTVSGNFNYKITDNLLVITYEKNSETEEYIIDVNSSTLISTHLQGYVDGKFGKIYWKRK